jgi:hypothetical protein
MARTTTITTQAGELKLSKKGFAAVDALAKSKGDVALAYAYLKQNDPDNTLCERQIWRIKHMPQVRALLLQKARQTVLDHAPAAAEKLGSLLDSSSEKALRSCRQRPQPGPVAPAKSSAPERTARSSRP